MSFLRVLAGEKPSDIKSALGVCPAKYDWRQLQRWGISESRLPPGSEIYFREPTLWDKYRWYIALLVQWLLAQVGLIIVLVE